MQGAKFGATSWYNTNQWQPRNAILDRHNGWHATHDDYRPQTVFVTFLEKKEIVRVSFQLKKDYAEGSPFPTEIQILATNDPTDEYQDALLKKERRTAYTIHLNWVTLAHAKNVEWAHPNSVFEMEISDCHIGKYHTYGISILKMTGLRHTAISRVKMWALWG